MHRHDESTPAAGPAPTLRGDVLSARSRMRTKYGSQRQILEAADLLGPNETMQFMAVAGGPSQPDRHNHGLLALTDRRLLFVPKVSGNDRVDIDLALVAALMWSKYGRTGSLTVLGEGRAPCFTDLTNPDGRELMALIVRLFPQIRRVGHL